MKHSLVSPGRELTRKVLILQIFIGLMVLLVAMFWVTQAAAISLASGMLINLIPSATFAYFAFKFAGARQNHMIVRSFRQGLALKLVITMFLFAMVFKRTDLPHLPLFIGYIVMLLAYWPSLIFYSRVKQTSRG